MALTMSEIRTGASTHIHIEPNSVLLKNNSISNIRCPTNKRITGIHFFKSMFDEYFKPPSNVDHPVPEVPTPVPAATTWYTIPIPEPNFEETTLQGVIPSNLHHLNQSFDTLTKLTKNHPLDNVIGDPSRPVLTRSQLQGDIAIWCYFDANDNPIPLVGNGLVEIYYLKGRIMVVILHVSYVHL
ncbi:hypothetical protein Tco_0571048 [Tanacetum coccineum]